MLLALLAGCSASNPPASTAELARDVQQQIQSASVEVAAARSDVADMAAQTWAALRSSALAHLDTAGRVLGGAGKTAGKVVVSATKDAKLIEDSKERDWFKLGIQGLALLCVLGAILAGAGTIWWKVPWKVGAFLAAVAVALGVIPHVITPLVWMVVAACGVALLAALGLGGWFLYEWWKKHQALTATEKIAAAKQAALTAVVAGVDDVKQAAVAGVALTKDGINQILAKKQADPKVSAEVKAIRKA